MDAIGGGLSSASWCLLCLNRCVYLRRHSRSAACEVLPGLLGLLGSHAALASCGKGRRKLIRKRAEERRKVKKLWEKGEHDGYMNSYIYLSVYLCICLHISIYLSVHLSIYIYIPPSTRKCVLCIIVLRNVSKGSVSRPCDLT